MNVPLIQKPETNDINASLIAIRRQLQILNESVNNIESKYLLKSELKELSADTVGGDGKYIESISENNGIINAVEKSLGNMTPVDTVTSDNTHSVTSNAVAEELKRYSRYSDYANGNLITSSVTSYTATEDCYCSFILVAGSAQNRHLTVNGNIVSSYDSTSGVHIYSYCGYIEKGSVLRRQDGLAMNTDQLKVFRLK